MAVVTVEIPLWADSSSGRKDLLGLRSVTVASLEVDGGDAWMEEVDG